MIFWRKEASQKLLKFQQNFNSQIVGLNIFSHIIWAIFARTPAMIIPFFREVNIWGRIEVCGFGKVEVGIVGGYFVCFG